ncbi:head-tail connector protein [Marinibacterium profundimaris]|uniref:Gene transfer agent protein n=1 Tax=Marinibacterium profundimaris TaxID=1679460 RepID=A0A225NVV5_9RHOB|nr:head-tail connector protein [Marinibacterium profundimaris]OWU77517.1 gene transfer agent protein [Marinibacterium profundimaris]
MMLIEETTFADEVLPVEEFKAHLKVGTGFEDDSLQDGTLITFLRAALSAIEARTGKALIARDFAWTIHEWANPMGEAFPVAPVGSIVEIRTLDADGGQEVLDTTRVRIEADMHRPILRPRGALLPNVPGYGSVTVRFTAGMSADWAGLPSDLRHAVLMLAAHYYEYRDDTSLSDGCMPFGVTSLIQRYRPLRLTMGAGQ